jgi:ATP-binding cassette subfamily F protein 3
LKGIQPPQSGNVATPKGTKIGYLPQEVKVTKGRSVIEEARSAFDEILTMETRMQELADLQADIDDYESKKYLDLLEEMGTLSHRLDLLGQRNMDEELEKVLKGLGFQQDELQKQVEELSGGWQMRVELAKILLSQPDLLLLDEPTNHLDIESIQWLEYFLKSFPGAVVLVTHDRTFLDNVTKRTIEISLGKIEDYNAAYSKYLLMREERREQQIAGQKNQEREIKQIERNIERFRYKNTKAKFAQSLIKKLDKMERIEVDQEDVSKMHIRFSVAQKSGNNVMRAEHIKKSYGELEVIKDYSLEIFRGDRIAFVGKNGMGKTTLAKILTGVLDHEGFRKAGHNVSIGYYAQYQTDTLKGENNVLEQLEQNAGGNPMQINLRGLLGAFLFKGDDIYKKVKVLSGGEKSRLALATLLLQPTNFLIMDEPTNHLDMVSKNVLKQAFKR